MASRWLDVSHEQSLLEIVAVIAVELFADDQNDMLSINRSGILRSQRIETAVDSEVETH